MSARIGSGAPSNYVVQVCAFGWTSLAQLVRAPSHSRRAEAARRWARHSLFLTAGIGVAIIVLMYALDATEIGWMPPRGTGWLWPVRILTEFGKSKYVLWALAAILFVTALLFPRARGTARSVLAGFGTRILFIFFAVLLPVLAGEVLKEVVGRGRPFVGGQANAFNFSHFSGSEAYASFPSGHATTAFALAFAVSAVWPHLRSAMLIYAVVIAATPSCSACPPPKRRGRGGTAGRDRRDAGAILVCGPSSRLHASAAMARSEPLAGPSLGHLKRVARNLFAP